ncbi:unnamed protein product [Adineta steineri]|uniref:JmjC domain-containing protein n=1 Tax=Adineta steineri TaxID=433720 RepID=A0A815BQX9_9BILA|nr:unnamed protein product [Adineta steineri]
MLSTATHVPVFQINKNEIQNLIQFIYKYEQILKEFGALKIQLHVDCRLTLKKRPKNLLISTINKQVSKENKDDLIYSVQQTDRSNESIKQRAVIKDETDFWSKLRLSKNYRQLNISIVPNKSFFIEKKSHEYFDIHRIPKQSLLRIGERKVISQCVPHVKRANSPGVIKDETDFWSKLRLSKNYRQLNISIVPNKSFFIEKKSHEYFDIHRIPKQSLLRIGERKVISQCVPHVKRANSPGAIFPLSSAKQHLSSIDYHHEGGNHQWYVIPAYERKALETLIKKENLSVCFDHGNIFIDPLLLDKNHIRYHRILQCPNEFVVLSAGTLAQSFTEDTSWSESIVFALPSWIEEGHANASDLSCGCDISETYLSETIDVNLFQPELIQKYIISCLYNFTPEESISLTGLFSYF